MRHLAHLRPAALCALTAFTLLATGCGRTEEGAGSGGGRASSPGITDNSIKIGTSLALSGPASAYAGLADGMKARFEVENAKGGVNGRKIELTVLDDGYEPQRALTNSKKLIEQDKVFALFGSLGTANNLAVWDYVNQQKVPHLFVQSGATAFGADPAKHPYTMGFQPDYAVEARTHAEHLKQTNPDAKVAVLYQNDDLGKTQLDAFKKAIEGSDLKVVAEESYEVTDPTITSQVRKLSASGADTFWNVTTPKFAAQAIAFLAKSSWKPEHLLATVSASKDLVFEPVGLQNAKGIVATQYIKEPGSPEYKDDSAVVEYRNAVEKYTKGDADIQYVATGWAAAAALVEALKQMKEPTRESLMEAAKNLDADIPILLPGVKIQTSPDDYFPMQALQVTEFDGTDWKPLGDVVDFSSAA